GAEVVAAALAHAGEHAAVVDQAVAVVVDVVADLGGGRHRRGVAERAGVGRITGKDAAAAAGAHAVVGARRAHVEALVDVAVAVVVDAVADLRRHRAAAGLAASVGGEALVGLAVAVVVLAVAGLDRAVGEVDQVERAVVLHPLVLLAVA